MRARSALLLATLALAFGSFSAQAQDALRIGSKKFTESVTLSELARLTLESKGVRAEHKPELGGTRILWNALVSGDIDLYVEYTGTLSEEILKDKPGSLAELRERLKPFGIGALDPLGFNNTYAIGMRKTLAEELGISRISDLREHPDLKIGFGDEFRRRRDGWPGLKARYRLPHRFVRGIDHDIAYRALETGDLHLSDLYSTDAEVDYYGLRVLEDDLDYFPRYEALILYRRQSADRVQELVPALAQLSGKISSQEMTEMNRLVKIDHLPSGQVAADFLNKKFETTVDFRSASRTERLLLRTQEHLMLVLVSLLAAILVGIPLGILAERFAKTGRIILGVVGVIQTVPALALLVILIRPLNAIGFSGIGDTPALIALFLYSLLPIVRSTHSGLEQIPLQLRETASVLGLSEKTRLLKIQLPLALPSILSGIKTSAVLNVGFATLGALIGAGGYGQPILTGIRLDSYGLILEGAIPAAVLAIAVQALFEWIDSWLVSPGLRTK